jgi:hypothetical protein
MLKENSQNFIVLETWQGTESSPEVFYIHAIFSEQASICYHLDGAIILFNPEDKDILFHQGNKLKGYSYQKQFRLDGEIPIQSVFKIVNEYFPIDSLTHECFGLDVIDHHRELKQLRVKSFES